MKKQFTEEQIIKIIKEHESGKKATSYVNTTYLNKHSIAGNQSTLVRKHKMQKDLSSLKK